MCPWLLWLLRLLWLRLQQQKRLQMMVARLRRALLAAADEVQASGPWLLLQRWWWRLWWRCWW